MRTQPKVDRTVAGIGWGDDEHRARAGPGLLAADVADGVLPALPRDTKEEDTITWLLARTLREPLKGELWVPYPPR